ncbi:Hypothetical protein, putative [Bodo saltans]|uniref:MSP domain-containing protein n=1 Tax=Bodo saltans TaxID=75058 RepID=A0A0S4J843_BODSA|nr:Hypothetical protein, putative [Bodo saltans]|eukprot:CUG87562.1 Hypothetical protein, putative [Bodo saltans]
MPSTAQSSKKPLSQQTNRSGKGAAAPPAATQMASTVADDFAAASALKDIVSGDRGDAGAGSGRHQHHAPHSFADDNDPWLAAAEVVAEDEAAFLEASAPSLAWAKRRSTFFSEKPSSSYLIEDILGEFVPASEVPEPAPYTIDAIGMAKDYSTGLEAKYGYKVPRGLHEVGKVTPRKYDAENTRNTIGQHDSGGAVPSPPFTGAETIKRNQQLEEEEAELAATALLSASGKLKSPAPPSTLNKSAARRTQLRAADNDIAEDSKLDAATINKQQTKLKTSLARPQLQCNFETIELRAGPRQTQELVLELWNTSAYSLRVKIARSPWLPQLTVEPHNPSTYNPEASVAPGTSLLVRVAFCPTEASVADCEKDLKYFFFKN